ncbi:phosphoadenosine phosphosulfate reductase domain-containing protein [Pseudomonas aeruginosa]
MLPPVATTPEIDSVLQQKTVVAFGVSGGKDSIAGLIATHRYLNSIGFTGPRLAVHADLGSVEWDQSLFKCQEAAEKLGWEMDVTTRQAGGMMERWLSRWSNNTQRYTDLSCVQLILPWSTPSMRFCTSELKVAVIRSRLKKLYPDYNIVNATGIRREESSSRAKMPIAKHDPQTARRGFEGYQWNPIIEWSVGEVWGAIASEGLDPHEAYTRFNMSRVSCLYLHHVFGTRSLQRYPGSSWTRALPANGRLGNRLYIRLSEQQVAWGREPNPVIQRNQGSLGARQSRGRPPESARGRYSESPTF